MKLKRRELLAPKDQPLFRVLQNYDGARILSDFQTLANLSLSLSLSLYLPLSLTHTVSLSLSISPQNYDGARILSDFEVQTLAEQSNHQLTITYDRC